MPDRPPLPDFVIIGAAKGATTWLRDQLLARPDVYLPKPEPHFFSREYDCGEDWYRDWFALAQKDQLVGEKSADYLADPQVPQRMHSLLPDARLIVQLRNPIDRAYSDYCMFYRRGSVGKDIRCYLDPARQSPNPRFLSDSGYCASLERYLEYFPSEKIKILIYEDILMKPHATIGEVEQFLGLGECDPRLGIVDSVNVKDAPLLPLALRRTLAPAKRLVTPLRSHKWFKSVRGVLAREVAYPALPDDLRRAMRDHFAREIEKLERLIDRDLSHWLSDGSEPHQRGSRYARNA